MTATAFLPTGGFGRSLGQVVRLKPDLRTIAAVLPDSKRAGSLFESDLTITANLTISGRDFSGFGRIHAQFLRVVKIIREKEACAVVHSELPGAFDDPQPIRLS